MTFPKEAFDSANVIECPDEMGFIPTIVMGSTDECFTVAALANGGLDDSTR
jgi:hypothetical protein